MIYNVLNIYIYRYLDNFLKCSQNPHLLNRPLEPSPVRGTWHFGPALPTSRGAAVHFSLGILSTGGSVGSDGGEVVKRSLPETNAPENWWLEDECYFWGKRPNF